MPPIWAGSFEVIKSLISYIPGSFTVMGEGGCGLEMGWYPMLLKSPPEVLLDYWSLAAMDLSTIVMLLRLFSVRSGCEEEAPGFGLLFMTCEATP